MKTINLIKRAFWCACAVTIGVTAAGCGNTQMLPGLNTNPTAAKQTGGVDGGGGDIPQSTEGQVTSEAESAFRVYLPFVFYNLALFDIDDPYVKRVTAKFYNGDVGKRGWEETQPVMQDFKKTNFNLKPQGGCLEFGGHSHPMAVEHFSLAEPICVSIELLRALPPENLRPQIIALFVHEFAHHFGFGEFDATKIQYYVLRHLDELSWFPGEFSIKLNNVRLKHEKLDPTEYSSGTYFFQSGKLVENDKVNEEEPYCALTVRYDDKLQDEIYKTKRPADLQTGDVYLRLNSSDSSYSCSSDYGHTTGCEVKGVDFFVNRVWKGTYFESAGSPVSRTDGKASQSAIMGVRCRGKNLKYMDVSNAFKGEQK